MSSLAKAGIVLAHGFVGWALCGVTMAISLAISSLETALVIHALAVPVIFGLISLFYYGRFRFLTPLQTALAFLGVVVLLDIFVVALLIEGSLEMFTSLIGTWIPFLLIGLTTYLVGQKQKK